MSTFAGQSDLGLFGSGERTRNTVMAHMSNRLQFEEWDRLIDARIRVARTIGTDAEALRLLARSGYAVNRDSFLVAHRKIMGHLDVAFSDAVQAGRLDRQKIIERDVRIGRGESFDSGLSLIFTIPVLFAIVLVFGVPASIFAFFTSRSLLEREQQRGDTAKTSAKLAIEAWLKAGNESGVWNSDALPAIVGAVKPVDRSGLFDSAKAMLIAGIAIVAAIFIVPKLRRAR